MGVWKDRFMPKRLGNRLFLAFVLLILLPLMVFQFYQFSRLKNMLHSEMSVKSRKQTEYIKAAILDLRSGVFESYLQLERIPEVRETFKGRGDLEELGAPNPVSSYFQSRANDKPLLRFVKVTLADTRQKMYGWNAPPTDDFRTFVRKSGFEGLGYGSEEVRWTDNGKELYAVYREGQDAEPYAWLHQAVDYEMLLFDMARGLPIHQHYYVLDMQNGIIAATGSVAALEENDGGYITHRMDLYGEGLVLVSRLPLDQYFGNLQQLQRQSLLTLLMVAALFSCITYFTASAITRPLNLLQKKMSEMVSKQFNTKLPVDKYRGEIRELAESFNGMVTDLQNAVQRLKREERQREAIRFQMLMSQMNPHFLLNTLNTIKWNVTDKNDMETAEICVALGRLLEASLNDEADLIFLKNELELVRAYAQIQNFRYDHRFKVSIEHDVALVYALVPKLSLQPLVENCIVHGLQFMKTGGEIHVRIYMQGKELIVEVDDNGIGLDAAAKLPRLSRRKGIGVSNLRERLQLLYRQEASLELIPLPKGTRSRLRIPFLYSKPYAEE
jgi:two-component system, sensor histidine kinase YesM